MKNSKAKFITHLVVFAGLIILSFFIFNNAFAQLNEPSEHSNECAYLGVNFGSRLMNSDLSQYTIPTNILTLNSSTGSNYLTDLEFGYQFSNLFGIELGAEFDPIGGFNASGGSSGSSNGSFSSTVSIFTFYVMPTYRFAVRDDMFEGLMVNTFGFRIGQSFLQDTVNTTGGPNAGAGVLDANTQTFDFGLVYRIEQFLDDHFSLGFEFACDFVKFDGLNINNSTSGNVPSVFYETPPSANLSNFSAKIALNYWFSLPFKLEGLNHTGPELSVSDLAEQNRTEGNAMLDLKKYAQAAAFFKVALLYDRKNTKAWIGLGNAFYHLGYKKEATQSFNNALELDPSNEKLRKFLAQYK